MQLKNAVSTEYSLTPLFPNFFVDKAAGAMYNSGNRFRIIKPEPATPPLKREILCVNPRNSA